MSELVVTRLRYHVPACRVLRGGQAKAVVVTSIELLARQHNPAWLPLRACRLCRPPVHDDVNAARRPTNGPITGLEKDA